MGLTEVDGVFAKVGTVARGGQAAQAGVKVKDVISAVDSEQMTYEEALATIASKPRPITVSFYRGPPPSASTVNGLRESFNSGPAPGI